MCAVVLCLRVIWRRHQHLQQVCRRLHWCSLSHTHSHTLKNQSVQQVPHEPEQLRCRSRLWCVQVLSAFTAPQTNVTLCSAGETFSVWTVNIFIIYIHGEIVNVLWSSNTLDRLVKLTVYLSFLVVAVFPPHSQKDRCSALPLCWFDIC